MARKKTIEGEITESKESKEGERETKEEPKSKVKPKLKALAPIEDVKFDLPEEERELIAKISQINVGPEGAPDLTPEELQSLSSSDPEFHRLLTGDNTIEDFLKKGPDESDQIFTVRSQIARKISSMGAPTGPIDMRSSVVLGSMIAQKVVNGIVYSDKIEAIIQLVISKF